MGEMNSSLVTNTTNVHLWCVDDMPSLALGCKDGVMACCPGELALETQLHGAGESTDNGTWFQRACH